MEDLGSRNQGNQMAGAGQLAAGRFVTSQQIVGQLYKTILQL
jgi:hypothetical protein